MRRKIMNIAAISFHFYLLSSFYLATSFILSIMSVAPHHFVRVGRRQSILRVDASQIVGVDRISQHRPHGGGRTVLAER